MRELEYADFVRALREDPEPRVSTERREHGAVLVRLDDAPNRNALSGPLTVQLRDALEGALAEPGTRSVVLTGRDPFFSVGGDWKLMRERAHTYEERAEGTTGLWQWIRHQFGGIARLVAESDVPVVAALNGDAAGVAFAWVLACDLVVASERARLVPAFGRIGLLPEVGTSWALSRRLGPGRAFELFVRGDAIPAERAAEIGLVTEVVAHEALLDAADAWCARIARLPEPVVRMTKPLLRHAADLTWHQSLLAEEFAEPHTFTTRAHREAVEGLLAGREKALRR